MGMNREPDEVELSSDIRHAAAELRDRFGGCPEPALLLASGAGVLPADLNTRVIAHLENCSVCKSMAQDLADLHEAPMPEQDRMKVWGQIRVGIAAEGPREGESSFARRRWQSIFRPLTIAAAATAVILISISVMVGVKLRRGSPGGHESAVLNGIPEPAASQPVGQASPEQSNPSPSAGSAFRLEKAPVRLPASAVMVWRGQADSGNPQGKELEEALAPYRADNYAEAEQRLERVARKYPRLGEARFYLGICQLFLNQNQEAAANLKMGRSLVQKQLAAAADWYLALAYHRSGQDSEARPLLEKLCRAAGKNSARACAALSESSTAQ